MSFITTFMKNVKDFYSEINGATLTGAIDVIVVEQEDGSLNSSPFHVRFGKMGVLKAREKIVDLEINGEPVDIWMKLDDTGAAFFVEDVDDDDDALLPEDLATSPLPDKKAYYDRDDTTIVPDIAETLDENIEEDEDVEENRNLRKKRKKRRELMLTRSGSKQASSDDMFDIDGIHDADTDDEILLGKELTISELVDIIDPEPSSIQDSRVSFSSGYHSDPDTFEARRSDYSQVDLMSKSFGSTLHENEDFVRKISNTYSEPSMLHFNSNSDQVSDDVSWKWGELPKHEESRDNLKQEAIESEEKPQEDKSWFSWSKQPKSVEEPVGVYLDDIEQDPDLMKKYIGDFKTEQNDPIEESGDKNSIIERVDSVLDSDGNNNKTEPSKEDQKTPHFPDLALSLCREIPGTDLTPDKFQSREISYSDFVEKIRSNPNFLAEKEVLIRLNEKYLPWDVAAPILLSSVLFKQPLPEDLTSELTKDCQNVNISLVPETEKASDKKDQKSSSWFGWFGKSSQESEPVVEIDKTKEPLKIDIEAARNVEEILGDEPEFQESEKRFRKTIRLTSEQLKKLNLKRGSNELEFSVTTAFQGTSRARCHIYLWHHSDKVVISDIDGTITKSDVLGHLLPVIGRDWAQSGVAQLYTKIRNNGYQIIYLSARAIGQASITKEYLQSLKQGDVCLPDGPLFLNPDSLIHAFKREVIDRNPEEFKIRCLKDIQSLFDGKNPFFAGYGNRPNDAYAYRAVGIPISRIFTINPAGELRHELTQNFQTSYETLSTEVDYYFPNIQTVKQIQEKFNAFPRKQSVYFDASDYQSIEEVAVEASENLSDTEDQIKPFRLRSGTDISDSLSTARLKIKNLKNKKVDSNGCQVKEQQLLTQKSLEEDGMLENFD